MRPRRVWPPLMDPSLHFRVGKVEDPRTAVAQESVNAVGADSPADLTGGLRRGDLPAEVREADRTAQAID